MIHRMKKTNFAIGRKNLVLNSKKKNSSSFKTKLFPTNEYSNFHNYNQKFIQNKKFNSVVSKHLTSSSHFIRNFSKDLNNNNKIAKSLSGPTICAHPQLYGYILKNSLREHPILTQLRKEKIEPHPVAVMSSSPDQSQFLNFLIKSTNSKKVLEYGVFLGYSTISMALALPEKGKLYGLDTSREYTDVATEYIQKIPELKDKIEIIIGNAKETGKDLIKKHENTFDFIFIDANKKDYDTYYEQSIQLSKTGGIIAIDNTFFQGRILDKSDEFGSVISSLNMKIKNDQRVDISMLSIADGVTLCRKV